MTIIYLLESKYYYYPSMNLDNDVTNLKCSSINVNIWVEFNIGTI